MAQSKDEPDQQTPNPSATVVEKEIKRDFPVPSPPRDHAPSKVVIRRLPPTLTPEGFLEHVSPLPDYDFFYFVRADMSLGQNAFTRAYINFLSSDDIFIFRDRFDGYVFLDAKGGEFPAIVEFAPFQKVPKKKTKKLDTKIGLIEQDADYKKFVETHSKPAEANPVSLDAMVAEVETKESAFAKLGTSKVSTPLLDYLRKRREERKLNIAKLKEERRRGGGGGRDRDLDRKRSGKDELDKRKPTSSKDGLRDRDRRRDRVRIRERDRRRERDGPRSEKPKDVKSGEKRWQKDAEVAPRHTVMLLRNTDRESHSSGKGSVGEWERKDKEITHESPSENEQGRSNELKRDERSWKRDGRWGEAMGREDERSQYGGKERGRGSEEDKNKERYSKDKGGRGYREERYRHPEEKGGGDKYSGKDRVGGVRGIGSRSSGGGSMRDKYDGGGSDRKEGGSMRDKYDGGGSDRRGGGGSMRDKYDGGGNDRKEGGSMRDKYDGGGSDRKEGGSMRDKYDGGGSDRKEGGAGDGWRKKEADVDKKRSDKEKVPDKQIQDSGRARGKDDEKKEREEGLISSNDDSRDEKDRQKEEGKSARCVESRANTHTEEANSHSHPDSCNSPVSTSRLERDENDEREGSTEGDDKKRKRKDRPERQIYIPRKALERNKLGSPLLGKSSDDKTPEPS